MPVEVRRWVFIHVVCFMRLTASTSSTVVFFFLILVKEIVQDVARDCLQKLLYTQSLD